MNNGALSKFAGNTVGVGVETDLDCMTLHKRRIVVRNVKVLAVGKTNAERLKGLLVHSFLDVVRTEHNNILIAPSGLSSTVQ